MLDSHCLLLPWHVQGGEVPPAQELAEEKFLSALPFLPPLTEKTLNNYYTFYACFGARALCSLEWSVSTMASAAVLRFPILLAFCACLNGCWAGEHLGAPAQTC